MQDYIEQQDGLIIPTSLKYREKNKQASHPISTGPWMSPDGKVLSDEVHVAGCYYPFNYKLSTTEPREVVVLSITSPKLTNLLVDVSNEFGSHWDEKSFETQPSQTENNFWRVIWCWNLLFGRQLDPQTSKARDELSSLVNFLKGFKTFEHMIQNSEAHKPHGTVVFDHLWSLFPPGEIIFAASTTQLQVLLVNQASYKSIGGGFRLASANKVMELSCCYYDFDGQRFNRYNKLVEISYFERNRAIDSLSYYPLIYHRNEREVREELKARGTQFRHYCTQKRGQQMFDYDGDLVHIPNLLSSNSLSRHDILSYYGEILRNEDERFWKTIPYTGRVIVDFGSYLEFGTHVEGGFRINKGSGCRCDKCFGNSKMKRRLGILYDNICKDDGGIWPKFDETQLILCSPYVKGYALATKRWSHLLVNHVKGLKKRIEEDAFNSLVMPQEGIKDLILRLVQNHSNMSTEKTPGVPAKLEDVIEGKGGGLVLLFYGAPGVGKSLTAESIAKYTGKPLLKVSVADFGTDVSLVEGKLEETFQIASRWRAVLLFDEADVFLEARATEGNLDRNAMASVFLKVLEYYQGILILTTNRVRTFDIAVQSRVHLAVRFQDLGAKDQKRVFEMFLNKMDSDVDGRITIDQWLDERFEDHVSRNGEQLNGRQIRNILSSAIALAQSDNRKLQLSHIKTMWSMTKAFQAHLHDQTILAKQRNE